MFDPNTAPGPVGRPVGGAAPDAPPPSRPGVPVEPMRVVRIVAAARRRMLVGALVSGLLGVVAARYGVSREYTTTTTLLWDPPPNDDSGDEARTLNTVADSVKLPTHLALIRARLNLHASLERIGKSIDVVATTETRVMTIRVTADGPDAAQRLAQATTAVLLAQRTEVAGARLRERARVRATEVGLARMTLEARRAEYNTFRTLHHATDLEVERRTALQQATSLAAEANAAQALADGEDARETSILNSVRGEPEVMVLSETLSHVNALHRAESEANLTTARARLPDENPLVQSLDAQVNALRRASDSAVRTAAVVGRNPRLDSLRQNLAGSTAERAAAERRRDVLMALSATAHTRAEQLAAASGEGDTLLAAIRVAELHLAELQAAHARAEDAARAPDPGLRVLSAPERPDRPSKSSRRVVGMAGPVLGVLLVLLASLVRGLWGLRVESPAEAAFWTQAPCVVASRWPEEAGALEDLALDLELVLADAPGTTLVVPVGAASHKAARALAARMVGEGATASGRRPTAGRKGQGKKAQRPAVEQPTALRVQVWDGAAEGPALRRAARSAGRVLLVVTSGAVGPGELRGVAQRLGRAEGTGLAVVGIGPWLAQANDQVGEIEGFQRGAGSRASAKPATDGQEG